MSNATCDALTAVGCEVLRASSVNHASSILHSVYVDAVVVSLAKRTRSDGPIRPGLDVLREAPNEETICVAVVHDGPLGAAEQSLAAAFDAHLIQSVALTSAAPRNSLVDFVVSAIKNR